MEEELCRLRQEHKNLHDALVCIRDVAHHKSEFYFTLAAASRASNVFQLIGRLSYQDRIRAQAEIAQLNGEHGEWHAGFNHGCLATGRLFRTLVDAIEDDDMGNTGDGHQLLHTANQKRQEALDEFPLLDT